MKPVLEKNIYFRILLIKRQYGSQRKYIGLKIQTINVLENSTCRHTHIKLFPQRDGHFFFLGSRRIRPLTAGNAHAPRCKFQNDGQAKEGNKRTKAVLQRIRSIHPVKKANPRKKDTKLYDIEVTEVNKANKKLKIYYIGYSTRFDEWRPFPTL